MQRYEDNKIMKLYILGSHNKHTEKWLPWCSMSGQVMAKNNSLYNTQDACGHRKVRQGVLKNEIDYLTIK